MRFTGPKDIKFHVKNYLEKHASTFKGKDIVDLPAGTGVSSALLKSVGANVIPMDLFPDFFKVEGLECKYANVAETIPLDEQSTDIVLCQEGIEHLSDQMHAFKEFNRILRPGGKLIITTPNYSNLRSRLSYFLTESEYFSKIMPPNELDSIWMADSDKTSELYYGHIFLVGIQKLRVLGKLSGFSVDEVHHARVNNTSALLLPFVYPWIWLASKMAYRKSMKINNTFSNERKKEVYKEQVKLNLDLNTLLGSHLFIEYKKEINANEVASTLRSKMENFDVVT